MAIDDLIDALERAAAGEELSLDLAQNLRWDGLTKGFDEKATQSWRRLVNFIDDEDIGLKDEDYSRRMKDEMLWRADELKLIVAEHGKQQSEN